MKYSDRDVYRISKVTNVDFGLIKTYLTTNDTYKNEVLKNFQLTSIISTIKKQLENSGLSDKYITTVLRVCFRKDSLVGLWYLLQHKSYQNRILNTVEEYKILQSDQYNFYLQNKGKHGLSRYGSLSLAYTNISPINLCHQIIKDSDDASYCLTKDGQEELIELCFLQEEDINGGVLELIKDKAHNYNISYYEEDDTVTKEKMLNQNISTEQLFNALMQDITSSGVSRELLDYIFQQLDYDNLDSFRDDQYRSQRDILDFVYSYFSQIPRDKLKKEKYTDSKNFESIFEELSYKIYNDPYINPRIIGMLIYDIGSKEFTQKANKRLIDNKDKEYSADKPPIPPGHWTGGYSD